MSSKPQSITEQLSALAKLRSDGVLTDEDFKALKAKLIPDTANLNEKSNSQESLRIDPSIEMPEQDVFRQLVDGLGRSGGRWTKSRILTISVGGLLLAIALFIMAGWWGSSDPDCGSSATQNLIVKIAKDHRENKLLKHVVDNSDSLQSQMQNVPSSKLLEVNLANQKTITNDFSQNNARMHSVAGSTLGETGWPCQQTLEAAGMWSRVFSELGMPAGGLEDASPHCTQALAPYVNKGKQLQGALAELKNQEGPLKSRVESEQSTIINDVIGRTATYWLDSIRMTAKDSDTKAVSCAAKLNLKVGNDGANMDITFKVENTSEGKMYATVYGLVDVR
jgi:hypothetical protein